MKKQGILNSEIATVLAHMGHTDSLAIADCGLPIPEEAQRIDLAVSQGLPSFLQVLDAVSKDMVVERVVLAEEIKTKNGGLEAAIKARFPSIGIEYLPHSEFKAATRSCKAVIRTGEASPYANVILYSGVIF